MSKNSTVDYILNKDDFKLKDPQSPPLKPDTDRFRLVELVNKVDKEGEHDETDYARIKLSPDNQLFGRQVDSFIQIGHHPSIAEFKGYQFYPEHLAYIKYYPNGSLQHLLNEINNGQEKSFWNATNKSKCVLGIVAAVAHIHNKMKSIDANFSIHYLCTENVIFDSNNEIKLINYVFGNEKLGNNSIAYIPPELFESEGLKKFEDTWDVGMILYEILTNKKPFFGKSEEQIKADILGGILPDFTDSANENSIMVGIIKKCLSKNPNDRPTPKALFDEIVSSSQLLFPGTNKEEYDKYLQKIKEATQ